MVQLTNDCLRIDISPAGAELQRIFHKQTQLDYLWNGDARFWGKRSPVLFPIVGALKNDSYVYKGKSYRLGRHGFARDRVFNVHNSDNRNAVFELESDAQSKEVYPFDFRLRLSYTLEESKLIIRYIVENTGDWPLYFSVGGHPAFPVPLVEGCKFDDYYLEFEVPEQVLRWPLEQNLISNNPVSMPGDGRVLKLSHELFEQDALVFKHLQSQSISLKSTTNPHGVKVDTGGAPYLGIWSAPKSPFVCIEPWWGIADSVDHDQQLTGKEGIHQLMPQERWEREWSVCLF